MKEKSFSEFFITVFWTDKLKFASSSTVSGLFTITGYFSVNILRIAKTWEGFISEYMIQVHDSHRHWKNGLVFPVREL